ncbi:hypothetical protein F2Q69_00034042 [Brassica cretica]|uniref:SCP domain-containing protein n=1 Tax=Brassica cretica TaxID=69181 RepID=A0A8S9SQL1_BRACR|nr:hypothetical protein F2Q69_00034042 [Brassica cretica]
MTNSCEGGMCGHYTQIVWRDTKRIGCARVVCENGAGVFITCNYDPPDDLQVSRSVVDDLHGSLLVNTYRRYDCSLTHSTGPYGENLFWGSGSDWTPTFAVESWTVEAKSYNHMTNSCEGGMCGHYTQIVWRDTKRIGCARVVCENGAGVFITCNYDPPGNYVGENPY